MSRHADLLRLGTVLDLASGDGRNAIFLARRGFQVTAVDISEIALERLQKFAALEGLSMPGLQLDLDDIHAVRSLGTFDNVIMNHFRPAAALWRTIPELLRPHGRFVLCAFNMAQHEHHGTSAEFCLRVGEYKTAQSGLTLLHHESFMDHGSFLDGYVFERSGPALP